MNKQTKENIKKIFTRILVFIPIIAHFYYRFNSFHKNKQVNIANLKEFTKDFPSLKRLETDLYLDYPDIFTDFMELVYILLLGLSFIMTISTYLHGFLGFVLVISYFTDQLLLEKFIRNFILSVMKAENLNDFYSSFLDESLLVHFAVIFGICYFLNKK